MSVLSVSVGDLRRLCGIDASDSTQDDALQAVLDAEQPVIEYQLDPDRLAATATDSGLAATLALGAAEILAGRYLQQQARSPGALDDFKVGPITVSASKAVSALAMAQQLGQHGALRLAPFGRAAGAVPVGPQSAKSAAQAAATLPVADLLPAAPPSDGAAASTSALGLFGTLQGAAIGTDDGEPPSEFAAGYVSFNDPNALGDT